MFDHRRVLGALLGVALCCAVAAPACASVWAPGEDEVFVDAWRGEQLYRAFLNSDPERALKEYQRSATCLYPPASSTPCPQVDPSLPPLLLACQDGDPVPPLWVRERDSADIPFVGGWRVLVEWSCPEDLLPPFTEEDLRALTIEALEVNQQPVGGEVLVAKPTIVFAEPEEREFHVVLFGTYGVDVVVTPQEYTWDFGDGETLTTTDPGSPYPDFDVTHTYSDLGTTSITLGTTWTGRYRVDSDPLQRWRDVEGTALTTAQGEEFEVVELRSHLTD